jgi:hypothetical protein
MFYEDVINDMCSNKQMLLQRIDEYTLYCDYLGYEPDLVRSYPSPLRDGDDTPSFGVFYSKRRKDVEFMWKDHAYVKDGKSGVSGDIFDLVAQIYGYTQLYEVLEHIKDDYGISKFTGKQLPRIAKKQAPEPIDFHIAVRSKPFVDRDLRYWRQFNVNRELLTMYNVTSVSAYWMLQDQKTPSYPRDSMYAYRIWDRYQLYSPFAEKRRKFRNNWLENYIPGYEQLQYSSDTLIITKAYKDVMLFRSFGYEAVAPRGEDIPLPTAFMDYAKTHYGRIVTWQDNDGKTGVDKYYPELEHFVCPGDPLNGDPKDPTDYCKVFGSEKTLQLINSTIWKQF